MYKTLVRPVVTYACEMSVQKENKKTKLKVALHARVNYRESYREHLATKFRHESKSWLAGSLRSLLRVPELRRPLRVQSFCIHVRVNTCWLESKNMAVVMAADCEQVGTHTCVYNRNNNKGSMQSPLGRSKG